MKRNISLNGTWELFYADREIPFLDPSDIEKNCQNRISAQVPGNFETSLAEAGVIGNDLYIGMTTQKNEIFEDYDWWYKKSFPTPSTKDGERVFLKFGAVDCLAEYFIGGKRVYESDNAFTEQCFEVTDCLSPVGEENVLYVHISSVTKFAFRQEYNHYLADGCADGYLAHIRKPAHSFGWDIFPRAVSGGLWRDVEMEIRDSYAISDFAYYVSSANENYAYMTFTAVLDLPYSDSWRNVEVRVTGTCGDSRFSYTKKTRRSKTVRFDVGVHQPLLWWPYGYGEPNVYDLCYELVIDGEVKDKRTMNLGIRTAELVRTETMKEENHCFKFVVNGVDIMCRGSNWVPLDAYHSRDAARYEKALQLFSDTHCNIVRVWGGGVYEQEYFYDYCDRHGILVWQDFCIACRALPIEGKTYDNLEKEATWAVKTLRNHPSLVLWSGDNEVDEFLTLRQKNPEINKITRELFPKVVSLHDTGRSYLASSPYITGAEYKTYIGKGGPDPDIFPERHLWGARDYFKADYYAKSRAHFVSEIGYHGCPSVKSLEKIVDKDALWGIYNEQWSLHSSDQRGSLHRVKLMDDQIVQLFGKKAECLEEFSLASQISQAEAKKYFIERIRVQKPYTSGIIWWNMLDGWPQMSDAVVDYFFEKKLAYDYIKRAQQPVALMIDEMKDWHYTLVASNDTRNEVCGTYRVYEVMSEQELCRGEFKIAPNANAHLSRIRMMYSDKAFLVIEWQIGGETYYNHYLCGYPAFDLEEYKSWLGKFRRLINQ